MLLEHGADPRVYASDGVTPAQVSSVDSVKDLIENWDLAQTESLLEKIEKDKERRDTIEKERRAAEMEKWVTSG